MCQSPEGIREGFTTGQSGVRIHYFESGDHSSTRALVLIPGWRLPAYLWTEQLKRFSSVIRVIAIDPRSQGLSSKVTDGNTPEARAVDLWDALRALRVTRPVLVGWSQGVQDVAAYIQEFGRESVDGVVLVDSPVSYGPAEVDAHSALTKNILAGIESYAADPAAYSKGMVDSIFKKPHPDLDLGKIVQATLQTPADTGIAMLVADIFGVDRRSALASLDKPALIIASAASPLLDEEKKMAASIPKSTFLAIEEAGHAVFVDAPKQFDDALAAFVESIGR